MKFNNYFKLDFIDAKIDKESKKRSLLVDLEISASGKKTNNRIYPPKGHRLGVKSWIDKFGKPVLLHHDDTRDPIGRVYDAVWESRDQQALKFLGNDTKALAHIKAVYDKGQPKEIYNAMKKYNAFNDEWPGLGFIRGRVKIVDQDAIDKFLDNRYLTWSAGQTTDSYHCMNCGAALHLGEECDHSPGVDNDGNPVVNMCGTMTGREISVVNIPANDTSLTLSMQLVDSFSDDGKNHTLFPAIDLISTAPTIIPKITFDEEKIMNLKDLQGLDIKALIDHLMLDDKLTEFSDALNADTQYEIGWLIRIHDALHSSYDYQIKYNSEELSRLPRAIFKLHGLIHNLSTAKGFRDSIMNGELDHFDDEGANSEVYVLPPLKIEGSEDKTSELILTDSQLSELANRLFAKVQEVQKQTPAPEETVEEIAPESSDTEETVTPEVIESEVAPEVKEETVVPDAAHADQDLVNDKDIDWDLLDMALETEIRRMGDAELSKEAREKLPASAFCGPDRSFPVPDCAHVTAARKLVGRYKGPGSKDKILACVEKKATKLGCDAKDSCNCNGKCKTTKDMMELKKSYDQLALDYANALQQIEKKDEQFNDALQKMNKIVTLPQEVFDKKLDKVLDWLDNQSHTDSSTAVSKDKNLKPTESPNSKVTKLEDKDTKSGELDKFTKGVVQKYTTLLTTDGKVRADRYLRELSDYLPKHFDITLYVKREE